MKKALPNKKSTDHSKKMKTIKALPSSECWQSPPGLHAEPKRATVIIPLPSYLRRERGMKQRLAMRLMEMDEFINTRSSGTLKKNRRVGMDTTSHSMHERIAYEFGYSFESCPEQMVTWGRARSEPDCKAITEAGWHIERYASVSLFPGDEMACKYITVEQHGIKREGIGIVIRKTSVPWIPKGHIVFAIVAEYNERKGNFRKARNPC